MIGFPARLKYSQIDLDEAGVAEASETCHRTFTDVGKIPQTHCSLPNLPYHLMIKSLCQLTGTTVTQASAREEPKVGLVEPEAGPSTPPVPTVIFDMLTTNVQI